MKNEIALSQAVQKLFYKVMKNAVKVEQGFIFFRNRTVLKVHFDVEECEALLKRMVINKDNVIRYLRRKYIPTYIENGAYFKDQKCIQRAIIKEDGSLYIHIAKSESHKIITDTIHVISLLREHGFEIDENRITFRIDQLQIAYQDTLLYNLLIKEFGMNPPLAARIYEKQLLVKYRRLDEVAKIKKRSVKRKFLRFWCKKGQMEWPELRRIINITDFSPTNVHNVCKEIREANIARGIKVEY